MSVLRSDQVMKRPYQQMIGLDEYAIRKKIIKSKKIELNTDTSKSKTSETVGKTNEVNMEKPKSFQESVVPKQKINKDKVIIEDWTGSVNHVRPNGKRAVHTVSTARPISTTRPFAPKIAQIGSAIRPIYLRMDNVRPRASYSPIKRSYYTRPVTRPKDLQQDVKISRVKNMTTAGTRAVVNTGKGKIDNALKKSRWV
ncbi:hypothetical protein Tco_0030238 [Tanacetum coccineum]